MHGQCFHSPWYESKLGAAILVKCGSLECVFAHVGSSHQGLLGCRPFNLICRYFCLVYPCIRKCWYHAARQTAIRLKVKSIANNCEWLMMIIDGCWWWLMVHDGDWWLINSSQRFLWGSWLIVVCGVSHSFEWFEFLQPRAKGCTKYFFGRTVLNHDYPLLTITNHYQTSLSIEIRARKWQPWRCRERWIREASGDREPCQAPSPGAVKAGAPVKVKKTLEA